MLLCCCGCIGDDLARAEPTKARVIAKATVDKLIQDEAGNVVGVEYVQGGQRFKEYGPVIISTGGFCADFGADSLLAKYRPDLLSLPTTNGQCSDFLRFHSLTPRSPRVCCSPLPLCLLFPGSLVR